MGDLRYSFQEFLSKLEDSKLAQIDNFGQLYTYLSDLLTNDYYVSDRARIPLFFWIAKKRGIFLKLEIKEVSLYGFTVVIDYGTATTSFGYFFPPVKSLGLIKSTYSKLLNWAKYQGPNTVSYIKPFKDFLDQLDLEGTVEK